MKRLSYFLVFLFFYVAGIAQPTIAIFTGIPDDGGMNAWDPDTVKTGITGSEEAVIYVSEKLAKLGYRVVVFADIPKDSPYFAPEANPRFVPIEFNEGTFFDVGISWRLPFAAKPIKKFARKAYLWPHDQCEDLLTQSDVVAFDGVLWLSESQRQQWVSMNRDFAQFTEIFGNGINPEQFQPTEERANPYSCIYGSSYGRGLKVLLDIWPTVKKHFPRATLDIYYGWRKSALISPIEISRMRTQIQSLAFLGVKEHGLVGHEELNQAYGRASFWTYPCTCLPVETFCISALRAQFAGAVPVIVDGSALKETVQHGFKCAAPEEYLNTLLTAMQNCEKITLEEREKQRLFILEKYTWEIIAARWIKYFESQGF